MAPVEAGVRSARFKVWSGDRLIQETPLYHRRRGRRAARCMRARSMRSASFCSAGCEGSAAASSRSKAARGRGSPRRRRALRSG